VEEEFGSRIKEESRGILWQRGARESTPTRVRMVHKRGDSDICAVQKVWRKGMPYREKQEIGGNQGLTKVVWIYREGSMAQRGKSTAKWHMTKRVGKCSQRRG